MKHKTVFIVIGIITFAILGTGAWLLSKPVGVAVEKSDQSKVEVGETNHDWGEIKINGGNAEKVFLIKNIGVGPLKLSGVSTSCMCTTAQVIIDGKGSPFFGMHQKSSWIGEVPAGKEAELKIVFDPAFHGPSGVGAMTRQIEVETNDKNNPKLEFTLKGSVVK
ncbi:DUF1573 domain-containing protein [Candidatus Collierbacteria bacterium]|nr:DUF1573 domain-containing protein [Candidatus Collierbacteria bacterium]